MSALVNLLSNKIPRFVIIHKSKFYSVLVKGGKYYLWKYSHELIEGLILKNHKSWVFIVCSRMEDVWITWSLEQNSSHGRINKTGEGLNEPNLGYFSPLFGTYLAVEEWYVSAKELSFCNKLWFSNLYIVVTQCRRP